MCLILILYYFIMLLNNRFKKLSCIVTFHNEGYYAHLTLLSIAKCREYFSRLLGDEFIELVLVLDKCDPLTEKIVTELCPTDVILRVNFGDLSLSRNAGINASTGDIISILDGDDYYSENYLYQNFMNCVENDFIVSHPEAIQSFGCSNEFFIIRPSDTLDDSVWYSYHLYQSSITVDRKIFLEIPYQALDGCYAYEDWHWNLEALALGYKHLPARETVRFYRKKGVGSLLQQQVQEKRLMRPSSFFDKCITYLKK